MTIIMQQVALVAQNTQNFRQIEIQRQQLETILQAIPDILLVLNGHQMVVLASDAVEALLRGRFRRSVIGLTLNELSMIDPIFGQLQKLLEAVEHPQHEWSFEARSPILNRDFFVHVRPRATTTMSGSPHHPQYHPRLSQEQQPDGYIILLNDVTALRNLTRFKDEMLRLISHDLRTPLVVITGYADLLSMDLEDTPNPALQQYVQGIFQASERMDKMLNNMLRAQQVQITREELHERVDLKALALEMIQDLKPLAIRKQIQVELEVTPDDIPLIDGDAVMLQQSMENFLSNAIKYTPSGGRIITRVSHDKTAFHFEIEDNGIGITPDDLPRLFEEYYRGDKTETHPGEGIGLGLALVRNVIREHGGDVWVESEVGKGSIFGFWLPLNGNTGG
jgi:signal transduction histidine kinase